jgi:hypothetical protein
MPNLGDIRDVRNNTHNNASNSLALPAFSPDPSNGDTIIVAYSTWTTTGNQLAPTDSTGANTYVQVGTEVANGKPEIISLWYAHNITGGSSFVVTGHLTANQYHTACAWLISGDFTYNSDFKSNGGSTNVSPFSTGVSTPAPSGVAIFLGVLCIDTSLPTASDGTGWNDTSGHGFTSTLQGRSRYTPFTTIDIYTQYKYATGAGLAAEWGMTGGASHNYNCLVASFSNPLLNASSFSALTLAP